jgi:hypothetical protein
MIIMINAYNKAVKVCKFLDLFGPNVSGDPPTTNAPSTCEESDWEMASDSP